MANYGFEVKLNNEKLCRAGITDEHYVVTCDLVSLMRQEFEQPEISMRVGGLNAVTNQHVQWTDKILKKGDTITIEVIDSSFDEPVIRKTQDTEESRLERKIRHYYQLKEELKDHLGE